MERSLLPDSFQADDSFVNSQQCSADPSAFAGFQVAPSAENVEESSERDATIPHREKRLRLVLDLDEQEEPKTRGADFEFQVSQSSESQVEMRNQFSELFAKDTQDEEPKLSPLKRKRDRSVSPPPTLLASVESAWRAKRSEKQKEGESKTEEGFSAMSEYSEDLAPQVVELAKLGAENESAELAKLSVVNESVALSDKDSDRETDYEDELECTQAMEDYENEHKEEMNLSAASDATHDVDAHPYSMSDTGTQPYDPNSTYNDIDEDLEVEDDTKNSADRTRLEESDQFSPVINPPGEQNENDEAPSGDASQLKVNDDNMDYLTPRANIQRVENPVAAGQDSIVAASETTAAEADESKIDNDDSQDECGATQPSEDQSKGTSDEPGASHHENGSKHTGGTDSQTKAIRTLEFSFTSTGSQENEVHSEPSLDSIPSKTLSRMDRTSPFESSMSPVCPSMPTPVSRQQINPGTGKETRQNRSPPDRAGLPTGRKQKSPPRSTAPENQLNSTPNTKRRKRGISPDKGLSSKNSGVSDPMTPQPQVRRGARSAQSTPSSTPSVRTRAKILSPLPVNRVYASRARTIFKYKFEFCLTGFVSEGEQTLTELITEHGGKIPDRYQDVLYKTNSKAVVIGTPVSWRKRKFMQAVACGIPVVHPEWVHACVKAGQVVPFDRYHVPSGYSVTTRKFECLPSRQLDIFEGYSFGIVCKPEAKERANLTAFILKACGADEVVENLVAKEYSQVDVVLCDEYTKTCQYYKRRGVPIKDFQWVTECMILQRFLDPIEPICEPQRHGRESVSAASAEIGDKEKTTLKLYTGELVLADISGYEIDHFLLFNVCEILSIHVANHSEEGSQLKKKDEGRVTLHVGVLRRMPNSAGLSKTHTKVLEIPASQVKRRVVAISKEDFEVLTYRDESIFYFEDEEDKHKEQDPAQRQWFTQ